MLLIIFEPRIEEFSYHTTIYRYGFQPKRNTNSEIVRTVQGDLFKLPAEAHKGKIPRYSLWGEA